MEFQKNDNSSNEIPRETTALEDQESEKGHLQSGLNETDVQRKDGTVLYVKREPFSADGTPAFDSSFHTLYTEMEDNDFTEIYLDRSETESAVAELEKSNAYDDNNKAIDEQTCLVETKFLSSDSDHNLVDTPSTGHDYKSESLSDGVKEITNAAIVQMHADEDSSRGYDNHSNGLSHKRRCGSPVEETQPKRLKVNTTENIPLENAVARNNTDTRKFDQAKPTASNELQKASEDSAQEQFGHTNETEVTKGSSAVDTCPPVAIVTPMGLREGFMSETVSIKGETNNGDDINALKSDINAILDSFDADSEDVKNKESFDNIKEKQPSLKLTDLEFEKFKNDLLSEQCFKTLDGNKWTFSDTGGQSSLVSGEKKLSNVQTEIGAFEKVLNNFMQKTTNEQTRVEKAVSDFRVPNQKPFKNCYRKDFDHNDPNVILSNSELLRELLEDKPAKTLSTKNNIKRGTSVDLSFLKTDMLTKNQNPISVSSVLKTKTIEPIALSPKMAKSEHVTKPADGCNYDGDTDTNDILQITVPNENEPETATKAVDHGPLSLAEQRRASVTLHHKVPSISDLISSTGPLSKMDGDETEAILNEIIGSPVSDSFTAYSSHSPARNSQSGISDLMNTFERNGMKYQMTPSNPLARAMPGHTGRFTGNVVSVSNQVPNLVDTGVKPVNTQQLPRTSTGFDMWSVDFENMPPERRQILAARYGHLMRGKQELTGRIQSVQVQMDQTESFPHQHNSNSVMSQNTSNTLFSQRHDPSKVLMARGEKTGTYNFNDCQNTNTLNAFGSASVDPKLHMHTSANEGQGPMNNRMRLLMMQQLQRRRMMAQMHNQNEVRHGPLPSGINGHNMPTPSQQMPYCAPNQHMRANGQHNMGTLPGYPFSTRPEGNAPPHHHSQNGLGRQSDPRMHQGHPANRFQRQMSLPNHFSQMPSQWQSAIGQNQNMPVQYEGEQTHGHFRDMSQNIRQGPDYNMQGSKQGQFNNTHTYMPQDGAFQNPQTNSLREIMQSQDQTMLLNGRNAMNSGVPPSFKDQPTFGHQGTDFF